MPNVYQSAALREALGLPAAPARTTPNVADGVPMTQPEARLSTAIRNAVKARGGFIFKIHGGPTMMAGLPDLICCYRGVFIGFESKMPGNKPTAIQRRRHVEIQEANGVAVVVYSVSEAMTCLDAIDNELDGNDADDA